MKLKNINSNLLLIITIIGLLLLLSIINQANLEKVLNRQINNSGLSKLLSLQIYSWLSLITILIIYMVRKYRGIINLISLSGVFIIIGLSHVKYIFDKANYVMYQSLINRYQDENYLINDWWLNISEKINGYYGFTKFFSYFPNSWIPALFYIVWIATFVAYGWIFMYISKKIFNNNHYLYGIISFTLGVFSYRVPITQNWGLFALGNNDYLYWFLNPQSIGLAFGFISLFLLLNNKYIISGIFIGLSIIFHINTGQHFLLITFTLALLLKSLEMKKYILTVLIGLLVGMPNLLPIILNQISIISNKSLYSYIMIGGGFRSPHHILPSTWPIIHFVFFFILFFLALLGYKANGYKNKYDNAFLVTVSLSFILMLCGWLFVEIIPIDIVGKTQFFRLSVVTKIILLPYAVYYIVFILRKILYYLIDLQYSFSIKKSELLQYCLLFIVWLLMLPVFISQNRILPNQEISQLESWIKENTYKDGIFLLGPYWNNELTEFPIRANRAIVVDIKRIPFQGNDYIEWFNRICDLTGQNIEPSMDAIRSFGQDQLFTKYNTLNKEQLGRLSLKYKANYVVRDSDYPIWNVLPVYQDDKYLLYKFTDFSL